MIPITRRTLLKGIGIGVSGEAILPAEWREKQSYSHPVDIDLLDKVPYRIVQPYQDTTQVATPRDVVIHRFGWRTVENEDKQELATFVAQPDYEFNIDGVAIDDPAQYWTDIYQPAEGLWKKAWEYPMYPRPVGKYEFTVTLSFDSPVRSKAPHRSYRVWEGDYELQCEYKIRKSSLESARGGNKS